MSRIGKYPVAIPEGVEVQIAGQTIKVKGKKGELSLDLHEEVSAKMEEVKGKKVVRLDPKTESRMAKKIWPTMRNLLKNNMVGVSEGYAKKLEIQGVGYRCNLQGTTLVLSLGFSHEVRFPVPKGITIKVEEQTKLEVSGIDKQQVGQVAANIRGYKPPEPYKGKGIRYVGEYIVRKEGKKK
jgi:large subunit ribosomal protein L6